MSRKLASIQTIHCIKPIANAEFVEIACVLGWKVVVRCEDYQTGDKVVFIEVDSLLPNEPIYEFLKPCLKKATPYNPEGYHIRSKKIRGQISQGLIMPISKYPQLLNTDLSDGDDVTQLLSIKQISYPFTEGSLYSPTGKRPPTIHKTDETRVQSNPELLAQLKGDKYYIATKYDGTSLSLACIDGRLSFYSRNNKVILNNEIKQSLFPESTLDKLKQEKKNYIIQGELCGEKIQKNRLNIKGFQWFIFNIIDFDEKKQLPLYEMLALLEKLDWINGEKVQITEITEVGYDFNYTMGKLIQLAKGKYPSGHHKEGIVVRSLSQYQDNSHSLTKIIKSFTVLNNDYLLQEGEE